MDNLQSSRAHQSASQRGPFDPVDVHELAQWLASPYPPYLLDVREPSEFAQGHIKGATLIPLGSLRERVKELPKGRPMVVVCRSGSRSARAIEMLRNEGLRNLHNLTGGYMAWASEIAD